jgi:N-formylglutamate amidohydrolase
MAKCMTVAPALKQIAPRGLLRVLSSTTSLNERSSPRFLRHAPAAAPLPLVLDSPHSGEHYPDDFDHAPPRDVVRQAEDTHVARLYRSAPTLGATLIEAMFPRAYIDANRSLDDHRSRDACRCVAVAACRVA